MSKRSSRKTASRKPANLPFDSNFSGYTSYDETEEGRLISQVQGKIRVDYRVPTQVERKRVTLGDIPILQFSQRVRVDIVSALKKLVQLDKSISEDMTIATGTYVDEFITPRGTLSEVLNQDSLFVLSSDDDNSSFFTVRFVFHIYQSELNSNNILEQLREIPKPSGTFSNDNEAFFRNSKGTILWKDTPYEDNNIPKRLSSHVARFKYIIGKIKDGQRLGLDKVTAVKRTGVSWGCWFTEKRYLGNLEYLCRSNKIFATMLEDSDTLWSEWIRAVDEHTR